MGRSRLGHPIFTGAVAALAVNDHLLKPLVGSWWTGKLSDISGVFVVAVLAGLISHRPRVGAAVVGAGFCLLKLVPSVAVAASPVLGGVTRTDPTDLVALIVLVPAVLFIERPTAPQPIAVPHRMLLAGSCTAAVLTITATSYASDPAVDAFAVPGDGSIVAHISADEPEEPPTWAVSDDGGRTWRRSGAPDTSPRTEDQACEKAIGCFRVLGEQVQERSEGGEWRTSFSFSREQRRRMHRRASAGAPGNSDEAFPGFVAIEVVERPDGEHVVVAMGSQGVLHRSPDGDWERRPVLDRRPLSMAGPAWLQWSMTLPFALLVLAVVLLVWNGRQRELRGGHLAPAVAAGGAVSVLAILVTLAFSGVDYLVYDPLTVALSLAVFAVSIVLVRRRPVA